MRDPHVVALNYKIVTDEDVTFDNPPPVERETEAFHMRLADGKLRFEMKEHHATEERARVSVEPYLRAWELDIALGFGREELSFVFEKPQIVDRDPSPPETHHVISVKSGSYAIVGSSVRTHVTRRRYPEPPGGFTVSPDVETMWYRHEAYRKGRETLATMAYMCLAVLEASAGGREEAARQYGVGGKVLDKLGYLSSEVGDERTARKVPKQRKFRPHTATEVAWIEAIIRALIRRAGEWASDPNATRPKLTMADFPSLQ